jgi:uncharacterized protein
MQVIVLKDDRPGHYHQSEGVVLALSRITPVEVVRVDVHRRNKPLARYFRTLFVRGWISPNLLLSIAYKRFKLPKLSSNSLIVSAGGDTLLANVAVAKKSGCKNIFVGSTRGVSDQFFSMIHLIYDRYKNRPPYVVTLKPNTVDPDQAKLLEQRHSMKDAECCLLVGGTTKSYLYKDSDWERLIDVVRSTSERLECRWRVSTSRRTPPGVVELFDDFAKQYPDCVLEFINYENSGPGTAERLIMNADVVFVTEDSNSMITEGVAAQRPVVSLQPDSWSGSEDEKSYLKMLEDNKWMKRLTISELSSRKLEELIGAISPMKENHLDILAEKIADRLGISYSTER